MRHGPPDRDQSTCQLKMRYNGPDETTRIASGPPDRDPTNVIERVLKRKIKEHLDHPSAIRRTRHFQKRSIVDRLS